MKSQNKLILISGGMGGIGKQTSKMLLDNGYDVVILHNNTNKEEVTEFLRQFNGNISEFKCDITNLNEIKNTITKIKERLGKIDIFIHCAIGPIVRKKVLDINPEEFKEQFEVGTFGGLNLLQGIVPSMKENGGGKIIALTSSSIDNKDANNMAGYVSAKYALIGILKELKKELKGTNISVSGVSPEFTPTPLHNDLPKEVVDFISDRGVSNSVEEVAEAILYMCNEDNDKIDGMSYLVREKRLITL